MKKHIIILNPIDSLIRLGGNNNNWQDILSSPENCRNACGNMELARGAKDIVSFLRVNKESFKTVIVAEHKAATIRIIAHHFGLPFESVIGGQPITPALYHKALKKKVQATPDDAIVVSAHDTDLREARVAGVKGLTYGVPCYYDGIRCLDDLIYHLCLKLKKPDTTNHEANITR